MYCVLPINVPNHQAFKNVILWDIVNTVALLIVMDCRMAPHGANRMIPARIFAVDVHLRKPSRHRDRVRLKGLVIMELKCVVMEVCMMRLNVNVVMMVALFVETRIHAMMLSVEVVHLNLIFRERIERSVSLMECVNMAPCDVVMAVCIILLSAHVMEETLIVEKWI